jgi:hypothetical protein
MCRWQEEGEKRGGCEETAFETTGRASDLFEQSHKIRARVFTGTA